MMVDVSSYSAAWEAKADVMLAALPAHATAAQLKSILDAHANDVLLGTWALADALMLKFADGVVTTARADGSVDTAPIGYPAAWLRQKDVGFMDGPVRLPPPVPTSTLDTWH